MFNYVSFDTSYSVAIVMVIFIAKIFLVVSACTVISLVVGYRAVWGSNIPH